MKHDLVIGLKWTDTGVKVDITAIESLFAIEGVVPMIVDHMAEALGRAAVAATVTTQPATAEVVN